MKWIGAVLIVAGCGGMGFYHAASQYNEMNTLRRLIALLDFMSCELQYKLTPLPDLFRQAAQEAAGRLKKLFLSFAYELDSQISPDVKSCMNVALSKCPGLPEQTIQSLRELSGSLGRFDLAGQIQALESIRASCRRRLSKLEENQDVRLRSYQTLGLCAGAALVILFV